MEIKIYQFIFTVLLILPLQRCGAAVSATPAPDASTVVEYTSSGNQNEAYLRDAIPIGDAFFHAMRFLTDINNEIGGMTDDSEDYLNSVQNLLKLSDSCNPSSCKARCEFDCPSNANGPQDCFCKPLPPEPKTMCNMEAANQNYKLITEKFEAATRSSQNYLDLIEKAKPPTDDIERVSGVSLRDVIIASRSIDPYRTFYQNYNQIFRGKINTSLPVVYPSNYVVEMEYIKRKLDLSRLGFLRCNTPTAKEEDIMAIGEGDMEYKGPLRIDFILQSYGTLPDEPTNHLDYFCYSYQNI